MGMTTESIGHLIVTGEYEDRAVVAVVVGTAAEAQAVADKMTIAAMRKAAEDGGRWRGSDLLCRVEGTVPVFAAGAR